MMQTQRKYIYIGAGAVVGLLLLALALRSITKFGTLEITAPKTTVGNADVTVQVFSPGAEKPVESFKLKPGGSRSLRMHTGSYQVNGAAGNVRAVDVAVVKASSTAAIQTPTGEQRAIKQLAMHAECPVLFGNALFSYTCNGGEGAVIKHGNSLGAGDTYLYDAQRFVNLQQVTDGLLGFYSGTRPTEMQYLKPQDSSITTVTLPANIQTLLNKEQPNIVPQQGGDRFTLVFAKQNRMFMFQDLQDKNPKEIKLANGLKLTDSGRKYSITADTDRLVIYAGVAQDSGEGDVDGSDIKQADLQLYEMEYDTAGRQTRNAELPEQTIGDSFHRITGDYYALDHPYGVDFLHYDQGKFKTVYTLPDVAGWTNHNNTVYVQSDGTLYQFSANENGAFGLHSRFTASNFRVSGLYNSPQGVLFTAFSGTGDDAPLNVYQLLDTPQVGAAPAITEQPSFSGLEPLLEYGITDDQLQSLQAAFGGYAAANNTLPLTAVAATNITSVWRDPESSVTVDIINFDAIVNKSKTLKAKIEYSDLQSVRLYLYDASSGALVFDSAAAQ